VSVVAPSAIDPLLVPVVHRVVEAIDELDDVRTLHVVPVDGEPARFEAAQCGMLGLPGLGEAPISISSDPDERAFHAYTIRRVGPITAGLVALGPGDELTVRGPFGNGWPIDDAAGGDVVVIAGGIGLAPLRSAVYRLAHWRERFGRVVLLVGAPRADRLLYSAEYPRWRERGIEIGVTVDAGDASWRGPVGFVTELIEPLDLRWPTTTALLCGPDAMMHVAAAELLRLGSSGERVVLTLERNMKCGNGLCGHCQLGPMIVCRDGPVTSYSVIGRYHRIKEL
jgi:NAD(P)H-flavin reductase